MHIISNTQATCSLYSACLSQILRLSFAVPFQLYLTGQFDTATEFFHGIEEFFNFIGVFLFLLYQLLFHPYNSPPSSYRRRSSSFASGNICFFCAVSNFCAHRLCLPTPKMSLTLRSSLHLKLAIDIALVIISLTQILKLKK